MKTINSVILSFAIAFLAFDAEGQKNGSATTPIVIGADVAIVETDSGRVRGFIHEGTYVYKGIPYAKADRFMPLPSPIHGKELGTV
jgi:para-nitrobenzyl esterase